jgi:hypothetical protein
VTIPTDLAALDTDTLRAVRDDRIAVGDSVYRVLEQPLDGFALRIKLIEHMTEMSQAAIDESLRRLPTLNTETESAQ